MPNKSDIILMVIFHVNSWVPARHSERTPFWRAAIPNVAANPNPNADPNPTNPNLNLQNGGLTPIWVSQLLLWFLFPLVPNVGILLGQAKILRIFCDTVPSHLLQVHPQSSSYNHQQLAHHVQHNAKPKDPETKKQNEGLDADCQDQKANASKLKQMPKIATTLTHDTCRLDPWKLTLFIRSTAVWAISCVSYST